MSVTFPSDATRPVLDLALPVFTDPVDLVVTNQTSGDDLTLELPASWDGDDLTLDFDAQTIVDQTGADRSSLLASGSDLWTPEPLAVGVNDVEVEARGGPISAASGFTTESGAITGDALAIGGNWTAVSNSDTDDFSVAAGVATRTSTSDSGSLYLVGRAVTAGTTSYAGIDARLDLKQSVLSFQLRSGLYLRGNASGSDHLLVEVSANPIGGSGAVGITRVIGGSGTGVAGGSIEMAPDTFYTLRATCDALGRASAWFGPQSGPLELVASGSHSSLATAGALASGRVGIFDGGSGATGTRTYDSFIARTLAPAAFGGSAEWSWIRSYA